MVVDLRFDQGMINDFWQGLAREPVEHLFNAQDQEAGLEGDLFYLKERYGAEP